MSEVYSLLCASNQIPTWIKTNPIRSNGESHIQIIKASQGKENRIIKIGFVSGSFDGLSGKLVLALISPGLVENIRERDGITLVLTALCLPTPRSHLTDLVNEAFHTNINLPPDNKTEAIIRIRQTKQDFLIFADAGLDSRVFALAHERMAPYQAILWGWGGTLGIPSIDYYLVRIVIIENISFLFFSFLFFSFHVLIYVMFVLLFFKGSRGIMERSFMRFDENKRFHIFT